MRIAVTYDDTDQTIFQHFGHTSRFKIYEVDNSSVIDVFEIDTNGQGHGYLPGFLAKLDVDTVICGGFGPGMGNALASYGINVCGGVIGNADDAVIQFINGNLESTNSSNCSHHDHGEEHQCCGNHSDDHHCCGNQTDHHCGCH